MNMARKNGLKNDSPSITFNTRTKAVMADAVQDNIKEKVSAVREVVFGKSNNEIVLVLQYYDYDVEKAIQAYVEDGAQSALTEWHYSGTKPVKKKKNKKKAVASSQDTPKSPPSVSSEAESTTSLLLNGEIREPLVNGHLEIQTDISPTVLSNGPISPELSIEAATTSTNNNNNNDFSFNNNNNANFTNANLAATSVIMNGASEVGVAVTPIATATAKDTSPAPQPQRTQGHRQRNHSGSHVHMQGPGRSQGHGHSQGPGHSQGHGHNERNRTTSASSNAGGDPKPSGKRPLHQLERSVKDLHRQTVSLERLKLVFNEEVEKAYKRIKLVFDEIRTCLNAREGELIREMDTVKDTGRATFGMRQSQAADLKVKIDRADRLSETELSELRSDIKQFVGDRKLDEDLARAVRFRYDSDFLESEIKKFGEAVPAKCSYAQRCDSVSSVASSSAISEPDHLKEAPSIFGSQRAGTAVASEKSTIPHLGQAEAHELAELQRRLKQSLTLEGIPVETFPDRPASAPVPDATLDKAKPQRPESAYPRRNRGRRNPRDDDRRDRPRDTPRDKDGRPAFPQGGGGFSGDRVVLIGKSTRPQGGRPGRGGGRGRGGGYGGRGRGGYSDDRGSTGGNLGNTGNPAPATGDSSPGKGDNSGSRPTTTGSPSRRRNPGNSNQGAPRNRGENRQGNMPVGKGNANEGTGQLKNGLVSSQPPAAVENQ